MAHAHGHAHTHGPAPHPSQPQRWSMFRMTLAARLGMAAAVSVILWVIVLLTLRPA